VDDTRLKADGILAGQTCVQGPRNIRWPTAAELDTFLYARGGFPWRCYPTGSLSAPGIFNGYRFDTLGTRTGRAELTVPLSVLGQYRRVLWITDDVGAQYVNFGSHPLTPMTALRYMSSSGHFNTLATFARQGGQLWVAGGGAMFATQIEWNDPANDEQGKKIFSSRTGRNRELGPGRFMYDVAGWRSEIRYGTTTGDVTRFTGRFGDTPEVSRPGSPYASLPGVLDKKEPSTDPMPPNRTTRSDFYLTSVAVEYLSVENRVLDLVPVGDDSLVEVSALDTLYETTGPSLPGEDTNASNVVMTYYHGSAVPQGMVFSGINIWFFKRTQCQALVDFVLQELWGMQRNPESRRVAAVAATRAARLARRFRQDRPTGAKQ
jgi:hypothetical protein